MNSPWLGVPIRGLIDAQGSDRSEQAVAPVFGEELRKSPQVFKQLAHLLYPQDAFDLHDDQVIPVHQQQVDLQLLSVPPHPWSL